MQHIPTTSSPDHAAECAAACPLADAAARAVDRRGFLSQAMLAAAAAALAACGGSGGDGATAPSTVGRTLRVADYPALAAVGGVATVAVSGTTVAIVRTGSSSFATLSLVCPHEGGAIAPNGSGFLCSRHGARFAADGTWTGGQRTTNMRSYPTTYDAAAGTITIG